MNYCGIILVKSSSKRLPNKNYLEIKGKPVWTYAKDALHGYDTYIFHEDVNRSQWSVNADLFHAIQEAYIKIEKEYDAVINVMANCPQVNSRDVRKAVKEFERLGVKELRAFNHENEEAGLMVLDSRYLLTKKEISTYQGMIRINSKEIHTIEDFKYVERCL